MSSSSSAASGQTHHTMNEGVDQSSRKRSAAEISRSSLTDDGLTSGDPRDQVMCVVAAATEHQQQGGGSASSSVASSTKQQQPLAQPPPQQPLVHQQQLDQHLHNSDNASSMAGLGLPLNGRSKRLPCKARGMGESHTTSTAYFDIPIDLKHGAVLACSHRLCANSGRRFRYCQVCEVPVAKRNFQKRHSHGLAPVGDPWLLASAGNMNRRSNNVPDPNDDDAQARHRRSVSYDAADTLKQLCATSSSTGDLKPEALLKNELSQQQGPAVPQQRKGPSVSLSPKEYQWLALLHNRPSVHDTGGMEAWMTNIIDISERSAAAAASVTVTGGASNNNNTSSLAEAMVESKPEAYSTASTTAGSHPNLLDLVQKTVANNNDTAVQMKESSAAPYGADAVANTAMSAPLDMSYSSHALAKNPAASSLLPPTSTAIYAGNTIVAAATPAELNASVFLHQTAGPSAAQLAAVPIAERRAMFPFSKLPPSNTLTFKEKLLASEAAADNDYTASELDDDSTPETLANYVAKKAAAAIARAGAAKQIADFCSYGGNNSEDRVAATAATEEDNNSQESQKSQTSSVVTRTNIRRRRSVQDARQLMGLIKLSGLNENAFDDMF